MALTDLHLKPGIVYYFFTQIRSGDLMHAVAKLNFFFRFEMLLYFKFVMLEFLLYCFL